MTSIDENKVLDLFRQKTIIEIKDSNIALSQRTTKLREQFKDALYENYQQIIDVTNNTDVLLQNMKQTNKEFTELCFNDELYKLNKLPEFYAVSSSSIQKDLIMDNTQYSPTPETSNILTLSKWSISITNLVSRFNASSSSADALLDSVKESFSELAKVFDTIMQNYKDSVEYKCKQLSEYLYDISSSNNNSFFTLPQWISIYNTLNDINVIKFPWKGNTLEELNELIFRNIFEFCENDLFIEYNPNLTTLNSKIKIVRDFVATETFKTKYIENIESQIDNKFYIIDSLVKKLDDEKKENDLEVSENKLVFYPESVNSSIDISKIVSNSHKQSLGLTNKNRNELYYTVKPLLYLLCQLKKHSEFKNKKQTFKKQSEKLVKILEDVILKVKANDNDYKNVAQTEVHINNFKNSMDNKHFQVLINDLIGQVKSM